MISAADKSKIDAAKVVSFDIFDTLLVRNVSSPTDVFTLMNASVREMTAGLISNFRSVRVWAEKTALSRAQEDGQDEINFDQIYDVLAEATSVAPVVIKNLQELEISTDKSCMRRRSAGYYLYSYARSRNRRILFVSDMYLPKSAIIDMLLSAGIHHYDEFYLSSELGLTKRSGEIFPHIAADQSIALTDMLHIGDNINGDYKVPRSIGVECIHLPRSIDVFRSHNDFAKRVNSASEKHASIGMSVVDSIIADRFFDIKRNVERKPFFGGDPFQFGYMALGPVFLGFCCWLHNQAKKDGIERLYFLSRDGLVMKRVFDELFPLSEHGVESSYLYCSRRSIRVPSIRTEYDILEPTFKPIYARPLGEWLENNYGIDVQEVDAESFERFEFSGPDHPIGNKTDREILRKLVLSISPLILKAASAERSALRRYVNEMGVGKGRHAVVDIGYAGTMQKALSAVTGTRLEGYYFAAFSTANQDGWLNHSAKGYVSQYGSDENQSLGICTHRFIYESLFCSSEDTVVKFVDLNGRVEPVRKASSNASGRRRRYLVELAHAGAASFAREYKKFSPVPPEFTAMSSELSVLVLDSYLRDPDTADISLLENVEFEDLFGVKEARYIAADAHLLKSLKPHQVLWKESLQKKTIQNPKPQKQPADISREAQELAQRMVRLGKHEEAGRLYEEAYGAEPQPNLLRLAAESYVAVGKREKAIELLASARRQLPDNKRLKHRLLVLRFPLLALVLGENKFAPAG